MIKSIMSFMEVQIFLMNNLDYIFIIYHFAFNPSPLGNHMGGEKSSNIYSINYLL